MRWLTDGEGTFIKCTMKELYENLCRAFGANEADMYIRNGYTITEDGRLFKDGR